MNWFERHLNWTIALGLLGTYVASFVAGFMIGMADPAVSDDVLYPVGFIVSLAVLIPVWGWALRRKGRSLWWLLLGLFVPFGFIGLLCLENRSESTELSVFGDNLYVTDRGQAACSAYGNPLAVAERGLRILQTVARNPGMSIDEAISRSNVDVLDVDALVTAGLLRRG